MTPFRDTLSFDNPPDLSKLSRNNLKTFNGVTYRNVPTHNVLFIAAPGTVYLNHVPRAILPGNILFIKAGIERRYDMDLYHPSIQDDIQRGIYLKTAEFHSVRPESDSCLLDAGAQHSALCNTFDEAYFYQATQPARARAIAWEILWRISDLPSPNSGRPQSTNPYVRASIPHLEHAITHPASMSAIAEKLGISQTYFNRIFVEFAGCTPFTYLQNQRKTLALELLIHTDLPIPVIASRIGCPNLHHFNRTIHRFFGQGPRTLRRQKGIRS